MRRTFDPSAWLGGGLIVALLPLIPVISCQYTRQFDEDARWVAHSHQVRDLTADVLLALGDAETGQRGFLITGQDEFLQPYDAALARLGRLMAKLKDETEDHAGQHVRINKLEEITAVRGDVNYWEERRICQSKTAIAQRR